ncbi:hypothetical protein PTD2_05555 [Pseudoalteromonas tunicata D2]|jgi:hypothetical protein|uniref:Uncharacterized protein n=1 Tax=Pseudoalteromonas tunicata D2 TaxID=87626 RepID=A4CDR9_9GAMM|nr:hypothetical protein PTD2_05555 [Pseudoalteromonas tunicata D2]
MLAAYQSGVLFNSTNQTGVKYAKISGYFSASSTFDP